MFLFPILMVCGTYVVRQQIVLVTCVSVDFMVGATCLPHATGDATRFPTYGSYYRPAALRFHIGRQSQVGESNSMQTEAANLHFWTSFEKNWMAKKILEKFSLLLDPQRLNIQRVMIEFSFTFALWQLVLLQAKNGNPRSSDHTLITAHELKSTFTI